MISDSSATLERGGATRKTEQKVRAALATLKDPEIPILTLDDLGIIRWVRVEDNGVTVGIAPTYTGCPATEYIEASVIDRLKSRGYRNASVERVLSPAWTTDWISESGRKKLKQYGIAPPPEASESKRALFGPDAIAVECPRCNSRNTTKVSEFGSTPCKSSWKCAECLEPFEHFKCI